MSDTGVSSARATKPKKDNHEKHERTRKEGREDGKAMSGSHKGNNRKDLR
jgi:hypothetical protein